MTVLAHVSLNPLALRRIEAERLGEDDPALSLSVPLADGHELEGGPATSLSTSQALSADVTLAPSNLPLSVDNSLLRFFPPIRSQGSLGSCAAFSMTYYSLTYMQGLANNWDVRSDTTRQLSPKFTANLANLGGGPSTPSGAVQVGMLHGLASWAEVPYDSNATAWPTSAAIWRSATGRRVAGTGQVRDIHTEQGLLVLKAMLANGFILNFAAGPPDTDWRLSPLSNDPSTTRDDSFQGQQIATSARINGGHAMTVVGYNDDLWYDFNGNGTVDGGEKGALKIANSWGTGWGNAGFMWLSYDALRETTAVSGWTSPSPRMRAFFSDRAMWATMRTPGFTPSLLAECTLSHSARNQLSVTVGRGPPGSLAPDAGTPATTFSSGGSLPYSGTVVFDLSDALAAGDWRYFLSFEDKANDTSSGTVASCQWTDFTGAPMATLLGTVPSSGFPMSIPADGGTASVYTQLTRTDSTPPSAVTDLTLAASPTRVSLWWTAPGDDGTSGVAQAYSIRTSTAPITQANWATATPVTVGVPAPGPAGMLETYTLAATAGSTLYVALVATDEAGNVSALSNVAQATLPAALAVSTGRTLPSATAGVAYSTTLVVSGGVAPYRWAYSPGYVEDPGGTASLTPGTATGWQGATGQYQLTFPTGFRFPFVGTPTTRASVFPNGCLRFQEIPTLNGVCPFWYTMDLNGTNEGVFVDSAADHVTVRWSGHPVGQTGVDASVNYQVTLHPDGSFRFVYGGLGGQTGWIGAQNTGALGNQWSQASEYSGQMLSSGTATRFVLAQAPAWLRLDASTGALSGTPPAAGTFRFRIAVSDNADVQVQQTAYRSFTLVVGTSAPPTVAAPATATPSPVSGTQTGLAVLGADAAGEGALRYTWAATVAPAPVTFSVNGDNAAKSSVATFSRAGLYSLQVTITNGAGLSVVSAVDVTVQQTPTALSVSPAAAVVAPNGTQAFTSRLDDQFGQVMTQPAPTWSVSGGGTIDASGRFTAGGSLGGPFTVTAAVGGVTATAQVSVTSSADTQAPTVSLTFPSPGAVLAGEVVLQATAADDVAVSRVAFFSDGQHLGEVAFEPYRVTVATQQLTDGVHALTAKAWDAAGNSAESAAVQVTVDNAGGDTTAPALSITVPAADAVVSGVLTVQVLATDDVAVTGVTLEVDGVVLATQTQGLWEFAWDTGTAADGDHVLVATATDAAGNVGRSPEVQVSVKNATDPGTDPPPAEGVVGCVGCSSVEAGTAWLALAAALLGARRRRAS